MNTVDWFWTGGNNRADGLYGPPRGVPRIHRIAYKIGWQLKFSEQRPRLDGTDDPWAPWFAWYPVKVETDRSVVRIWKHWFWLRWIERRLRPDGAPPLDTPKVQYRLPQYAGRVGTPSKP